VWIERAAFPRAVPLTALFFLRLLLTGTFALFFREPPEALLAATFGFGSDDASGAVSGEPPMGSDASVEERPPLRPNPIVLAKSDRADA
jgi:hypothetical protein